MRTVCVLLAVLAPLIPLAAEAAEPVGEVSAVFGSAEVVRQGAAQAEKLSAGARVYPGDKVRTVGDSRLHLLFADGTFTQLAGDTEVVVGEYVFAKRGGLLRGRFDLALGKVMLKIGKLAAGSTFSVDTGNAIAGVRGTEFSVSYRMDRDVPATSVHVFSGEVGVLNKLSAKETKVGPRKWVELTGERLGQLSAMDEKMMNAVNADFRASSALRNGARGAARPAPGSERALQAQSATSPEVGLRNQYISPKGLTVPSSNPAVSVNRGPVAPPAPPRPSSPGFEPSAKFPGGNDHLFR